MARSQLVFRVKIVSILVLWLLIPSMLWAWSGTVIGVADGDTITVLKDKTQVRIRLYGIDCPERSQAFGKKAKQFTSRMVFKKRVNVEPVDKDRYGRIVAWVSVAGKNLNEELVRYGMAWHYKKYSSDKNLAKLELTARQSKVGLWRDKNPMPPWDYRRGRKTR